MVNAVAKAALTMNVSMTELQDQLAQQTARPNESQMAAIAVHSDASVDLLEKQGVKDPLWLNAVRRHHEPPSGPLADMAPADRIARLVERADIFAARLAPRVSRWAMPAAIAMRASYFDDEHRVDEAGAALITAMGVYPPGSFVKLASNETAIVLKRGRTGTTPKVAAVLNRQGTPIGEIVVRDTSQVMYKIVASVAHRDVKVQLQLDRMLGMI
jgi:HD-GYP domain-containing protein (c-di-GMP phosphodiesterase class II)